jgi:hypothetical protein
VAAKRPDEGLPAIRIERHTSNSCATGGPYLGGVGSPHLSASPTSGEEGGYAASVNTGQLTPVPPSPQ